MPVVRPTLRQSLKWLVFAGVVSVLGGCATGKALEVRKIDAAAGPPSNVAIYLKISREDGQPVTLTANDFTVIEDGKPLKKVKRALLPLDAAVDRLVLVLLDLSGPLVDSEYLPSLYNAATNLVERVGKDTRFGLAGFDGDGVTSFIAFNDEDATKGLAAMRKFRPKNRTVDLWGTYMAGLDQLQEAADQSRAAHHEMTLIVVTDRKDKAGRHSTEEAAARLQKSKAEVYVIGIGGGVEREAWEPLARSGTLFVDEPRELEKPFADIADKIEAKLGQDYVFSYCSGKRDAKKAAKHSVEVRIQTARWHGAVEHEFSTKGFGKEPCDPSARVSFGAKAGSTSEGESDADPATPTKRKAVKKKPTGDNDVESDAEGG